MNSEVTKSQWWELRLSATYPEEVAALLVNAGAGGAQILDEHHLLVYLQATSSGLEEFLKQAAQCGATLIDTTPVIQENWTAQCPELWRPISVGELKVIPVDELSPFTERKRPTATEILIVPGTGFGTGHHASTAMLLELLQSDPVRALAPAQVLDIGTGSGILAIASHKLFGARVVATDIDPLALENARQNVSLNECSAAIEIAAKESSLLQGSFALIVANIYAEVLCSLRPDFERLLAPSGLLLMSGIMLPKFAGLLQDFEQHGWHLKLRCDRDGWVSVIMSR